jgi:hypothetical protein
MDLTHQIQQQHSKLSHKGCEVVVDNVLEGFLLPSTGNFVYLQYPINGNGPHQTKLKHHQRECFEECLHNSSANFKISLT